MKENTKKRGQKKDRKGQMILKIKLMEETSLSNRKEHGYMQIYLYAYSSINIFYIN